MAVEKVIDMTARSSSGLAHDDYLYLTNGSAAGGSGIVIIRRLTSSSCSSSGTTSTCGSDTIHTFTADGTFVA